MSDAQGPKWRKVLVSGSNVHVNRITASAIASTFANNLTTAVEERVLVYNTSSGAFYYTGSYGSGGTGGAGNPAGNNHNIQFNNNGAFGGNDNFMFDDTGDTSLFVDGPITGSIVSASGAISGSSVSAESIVARNTDNSATIALKDADGNNVAQFARVGSGVSAHMGRMVLRDNSSIKTQFTAGTSPNFISNGSNNAKLGINVETPAKELTVQGHISASKNLFASTSLSSSHTSNNVVLVNTATGELYHTGSYGSGGGGGVGTLQQVTNQGATTTIESEFGGGLTASKAGGTAFQVGDGTSSPSITFDITPSGTGRILFRSASTSRQAFMIDDLNTDSSVVAVTNRATNGKVQIRANTSTAGSSGEVTVAQFEDNLITFNKNIDVSTNEIQNVNSITNDGLTDIVLTAGSQNLQITSNTVNLSSGKVVLSNLGHITASGNISASKALFVSTSLSGSHTNNNVLLINTATGELYHTGSYGSGGGGGGAVTAITNNTNDNVLTATGTTTINGEGALTFNTSNGLRVAGDARFNYLQNGSFGGNAAATSYKAGQFVESSQLRTYVTPQRIANRLFYLVGVQGKNGRLNSSANYLVYSGSVFFDPTTDSGGGHTPDQDDGTFTTKGRIQAIDAEERTGITISGNPGIFFFNNDASASVSGSFNFDSASAHIKFDTGSSGVQFLTGETTQTLTQTLFLSQSGGNATVGVGTTTPESIFDIQEVADNSTGTRILLKSARSSTEGAQVGDAAGSIFFAIDSASFDNVFDTGSVAEITTEVTALLNTGNSLPDVAGNIQLKSSPPHNESLNTVATVGHFPNSYFNPQAGTVDQSAALLVSGALLVDPYTAAAQGQAIALRVKNVKDASGLGGRSNYNDVFVITGSNAVFNSGSLVVGSGSIFLASATADSTTHYGTGGGIEFVNFRGQGPIKLGQVSSTGVGGATQLDFYTGDTQRTRLDGSGNFGIGTGTRTLSKKLEVEGQISASGEVSANTIVVGSTITHIGDSNTKITFSDDDINLTIAGKTAIDLTFDGTGGGDTREITFNESHEDIDVRIEGDTDTDLFFTNAGTDRVGIGTNSPSSKLEVDGDITSTHITSSGDIISTAGSLITTKTGSVTDPALHIKAPAGSLSGTNAGIILEELVAGTGFYVPYFVSNGAKIFGFGSVMQMETNLDLQSNKLYFDSDLANTYIASNADDPEDLEIHADQDVILNPDGQVIANSNISASGTLYAQRIHPNGSSGPYIDEIGGNVAVSTGFKATTELIVGTNITASGNISASGDLEFRDRKLSKTSTTDADHQGDVVFFGSTTSMDAGKIYHYNSSGNWELSNATDNTKSTGLLAVALGTASDTNGMLLKGMVTLDHDPGAVGDKLFLRTSNGLALNSAPGSTGNVVRVIGYCLDASNGQIYFNPSNDHIVHA